MKLNAAAEAKAADLIRANQYVKDSDWSEANPDAAAENAYLDGHDWDAYSAWHLGLHEGHGAETKARYGFPYGDFRRVHHAGLTAAKRRAAQEGYDEIEAATDRLLGLMEE